MPKHWDYEDDHDWDDDVDYKSMGYVYWYGKYYPQEEIDALFDGAPKEKIPDYDTRIVAGVSLLLLTGIFAAIRGSKKIAPRVQTWWKEKGRQKLEKE